jgi:hypothetical protein
MQALVVYSLTVVDTNVIILCARPVCNRLQTGLNRNWFRPVFKPQKTAENRGGPVYDGLGSVLRVFEKRKTGPGPGLSKFGRKTGLDRTFKHYSISSADVGSILLAVLCNQYGSYIGIQAESDTKKNMGQCLYEGMQ